MYNPSEPVANELNMPANGPVVFLTRDFVDGTPGPAHVWIKKPTRVVLGHGFHGVEYRGIEHENDGMLGAFTDEAVRERFGYVPGPDECVVLDNPKVN